MIIFNKKGVMVSINGLEELHHFAALIGLKRVFFKAHAARPHYLLHHRWMRKKAARFGAVEATDRQVAAAARRLAGVVAV